ncbi:sigma-70 family RNA polymerase sigma factor [Levilactobacillus yiduensis]|uniref:sigma-70 family RNA polymerase sigma factor n=1 Tax=Levilactobacillus yiduensis TaxID=2953880 RepID=UPI000EF31EFC|nr:sigma-70 family RNA polymerase sigma factor [Levilactobacillus yiduensis]AYM03831.1 sigma-70 family RNA polymerase sigma factor [Levilactobacillus brevis]
MFDLSDDDLIDLLRQDLDSPALLILFERYHPVLQRIQKQYFIPGFEQADWDQEALLILCSTVQRYQSGLSRSFGAFYRLRLRHRVFDLIRQSQALKRQLLRQSLSLEAEAEYFADTLPDQRWILREQLEAKEAVYQVLPRLSAVEHNVFHGLLTGQSLRTIGQEHNLTVSQVQAALHRSQAKLHELLAE